MSNQQEPENLAPDNERSLQTLVRTITLSQGGFSLILLRCNYADLRQRMLERLHQLSPIHEITLPASVKTLYTNIRKQLGDEQPPALMIFGLESVKDIDIVLTSANQVREEFRKNFPFPILLWINDQVLPKFIRLATDLENWATIIEFENPTDELVNFLEQKSDEIFAGDVTPNPQICRELKTAFQDLQNRGEVLEAGIKASLEFVLGLNDYLYDQIVSAIEHYQQSLSFWQQINNSERQGILLVQIALAYDRQAEKNQAENHRYWQESKDYLQQAIDIFEQAQRSDLVAKHITKLGEVLRHLQAWSELQSLMKKSLPLHRTYGTSLQLAKDYGFLAEVALERSRSKEAYELIQETLQILAEIPNLQSDEFGLYWFILAKSQQGLGQVKTAITNLEAAKNESNHQYNPQLYISILERLRSLYFEQGEYLKAFNIKQEQLQIEQQYGFRAFVGASYLNPQRQPINSAQLQVENSETIAQEIAASGRGQDVKRLRERIGSTEHKLTVIHGQSGVGKSSILQGGLIPALQQQPIGERDALPILLRVYTDWIGILGQSLAKAFQEVRGKQLSVNLDSSDAILGQLQKNAHRNLLTVLMFDQFEEFFFVYPDQGQRREFYQFLRVCLDIPFVKVILSLREDYLHYLLELDRLFNLSAVNNNILDKNIRYYLGNFSPDDAKAVVQSLTERSHFYLEPALIEKLVEDLAGDLGEVRPIELQIIGTQLQTEKITTLEKYRQFGTKEKLVERFLEEVIHDCGGENEQVAQLVLYLLTDENDTRPLKTRAELADDLAAEVDKLDLVLEIFVASRLVLLLPESPADRYQLVHDYLVSFIRQQQGNQILAELAREREQRLQAEQKLKLEQDARQILVDAQQEANRQIRQARFLLSVSSGLSVFLLLLGGISFLYALRAAETAQISALPALTQTSDARFSLNRNTIDALVEALKAGKILKELEKAKVNISNQERTEVMTVLGQAIYWVRERSRLQGHSSFIQSVTFSPNGEWLATASADKTVKLWDKYGRLLQTLTGHTASVVSVSFSPDSQTLASASLDGTVKLWSKEGKELKTLKGHNGGVRAVSFSPDGKTLATAGDDKTVRLWNLDGQEIKTLKGHTGGVYSISFSPDGRTLASGSYDNTVKLWNRDGKEIKTLTGLKLWNRDGKEIKTLTGHTSTVTSVSFSPDGRTLASASHDYTVKLWNPADGKLIRTINASSNSIYSVRFSPDSQILATGNADRTVTLWNLNGDQLWKFTGHSSAVNSVSFSPDGHTLASASQDRTVKLWQIYDTPLTRLIGHQDSVNHVSFSPDGQAIATASDDNTVKLWNRQGREINSLKGNNNGIWDVSFSPNGQAIATGGYDGTGKLWNRQGQLLLTLKHNSYVYKVSFSPDGQTIASASADTTVKLWNLQGQLLHTMYHNTPVYEVSFSPDGKIIASASEDKTVKLWNLEGKRIKIFNYDTPVHSVSFSPDGKIIAVATENKVKLQQLDGGEIASLNGHTATIWQVIFSPDGQMIATASDDNTVKLWDKDGTLIITLTGHTAEVNGISFSPDSKYLVSGSKDRTAIAWDVQNLTLDKLIGRGCDWLHDYLQNNSNVSQSDKALCDDIY